MSMKTFKEWQIICEALHAGEQSVILRKGGIHEGKEGFSFGSIEEFYLFPTRFHAQGEQVTQEGEFMPGKEWQDGDAVVFDTYCKVVNTYELTEWEQVEALAPYHIWSESCIRERFDWEGKGMAAGKIHLALLRVYRVDEPHSVDYSKRLGGCRSWVELGELEPPRGICPTLTDEQFNTVVASLESALK